ncbi:MAG: hypothetical protein U0X39_01585 [Bacteroidales bacterium]
MKIKIIKSPVIIACTGMLLFMLQRLISCSYKGIPDSLVLLIHQVQQPASSYRHEPSFKNIGLPRLFPG